MRIRLIKVSARRQPIPHRRCGSTSSSATSSAGLALTEIWLRAKVFEPRNQGVFARVLQQEAVDVLAPVVFPPGAECSRSAPTQPGDRVVVVPCLPAIHNSLRLLAAHAYHPIGMSLDSCIGYLFHHRVVVRCTVGDGDCIVQQALAHEDLATPLGE